MSPFLVGIYEFTKLPAVTRSYIPLEIDKCYTFKPKVAIKLLS